MYNRPYNLLPHRSPGSPGTVGGVTIEAPPQMHHPGLLRDGKLLMSITIAPLHITRMAGDIKDMTTATK